MPTSQKFPLIPHPMSRLGSRGTLSIAGHSRDGARTGDWLLRAPSSTDDVIKIPPSRAESRADSMRTPSSRCNTSIDGKRLNTEEVMMVLEDKLRSHNFHVVKNMFRANDPTGQGRLSKEAFSRVLWNLCGYLSTHQLQSVIRRLNLDGKSSISFEDLIGYFRQPADLPGSPEDNQSVQKRVRVAATPEVTRPDEAQRAFESLKYQVTNGGTDLHTLFPPMCFGENGYVIPGQMRECFHKLGIEINTETLAKIYRRMGGSPFAIRSKRLFKTFGLDSSGKPLPPASAQSEEPEVAAASKQETDGMRVNSAPADSPRQRASTSHSFAKSDGAGSKLRTTTSLGSRDSAMSRRPATVADNNLVASQSQRKLFEDDLVDFICKKLNDGHAHVVSALETKDRDGGGVISKSDFKDVLRLLGFQIKAIQLEHFLAKTGLRRKDGSLNYRLLLRRLRSRSSLGLLPKVMKNADHVFHQIRQPMTPEDGESANLLESKLLDLFQHEFLALLSAFRHFDPTGTGFVTQEEARAAIEHLYAIQLGEESWQQFLASSYVRLVQPPNTGTSQKGYIPYNDFLSRFDSTMRPTTAMDEEDPWVEEQADIRHLKEHKDRYLNNMDADPNNHTMRHDPRPLEQLDATLVDVMLYKFYQFKREYDLSVREDYCRVDKEKFDYILFKCGFILTPSELSRLWLSMPITRPMESLSIKTILQHTMRVYYANTMPGKFSKTSDHQTITEHVLEKIRPQVTAHWDLLKKKLRYLDPCGTSRIAKEDMISILRGLRPSIVDFELFYLVEQLESRIRDKTHYMRMLEYYVTHKRRKPSHDHVTNGGGTPAPQLETDTPRRRVSPPQTKPRQHEYRHPTPAKPHFISLRNAPAKPPFKRINIEQSKSLPVQPTVYDSEDVSPPKQGQTTKHCRGNILLQPDHLSNTSSPASSDTFMNRAVKPRLVAAKIPSFCRALRRQDKHNSGRIPVGAFIRQLAEYGVKLDDGNDLYKMLSRYDRNLHEEINYAKFLKAIA